MRGINYMGVMGIKITAIILAAGAATRAGEDKLAFPINGTSIFEHSVKRICSQDFYQVVVVTNSKEYQDISTKHGARCVDSPYASFGKSASVIAGVLAADKESHMMFFVADQPLLSGDTIKKMIACCKKHPEYIITASFMGKMGNPVIFPPKFREELLKLTGDSGGREIVLKSEFVKGVEVFQKSELDDVDTVEQYIKLTNKDIVVVRGAGDIATGVIQCLNRVGYAVLALEVPRPSAIRTTVALSTCVYTDTCSVEGITARRVETLAQAFCCFDAGEVPVMVDPDAGTLSRIKPIALVDAIIAKKNIGTNITMAPITIALGPGFYAGRDVHIVIETMRGHSLGRLIFNGFAMPNTGTPGEIGGQSSKRVVYSPADGVFSRVAQIGQVVKSGDVIAKVGDVDVIAPIDGVVRGLIMDGYQVFCGMKIADIDPRAAEIENVNTISDKARALGGAVLVAVLMLRNEKK